MLDVSLKPHKDMRAVGGCRLLHRLNADGAGEVYLAEQVRLGNRRVAVTVLMLEDSAGAVNTTSEAERRFWHKAAMLGRFTHPHILPIHDSGYDRGRFYLVTHYAVGGSLADVLSGRSPRQLNLPIAAPTAADLVGQIASALQYIHDWGVVHNDVQPDNILIDVEPCGRWHALLANFGRATHTAPEQPDGRHCPASDQYALAVVAFQLLSGHLPFEEQPGIANTGGIEHQSPSLRSLNPSVPKTVETVILRALAQEPADRYPSVAAFAQALQAAAQEYGQDDAPATGLALAERASIDADILVLHRALGPNYPSIIIAASDPTTSDSVTWATRAAGHVSQATPRVRSDSATSRRQDVRVLAVGIASLILLLLVVAANPSLWPLASSQGGDVAKSLAGLTTQAGAQSVSHGQVFAPPPFQTTPSTGGHGQPGTRDRNSAAPLPITLAVAVQPGQRVKARFSFANIGDTSWSHTKGYALSCASKRHTHATCLGFAPIGFGEYAVPPGGRFTFTVQLTAPAQSGTYAIWLNVGHNGQLFGTQDMLLTVRT